MVIFHYDESNLLEMLKVLTKLCLYVKILNSFFHMSLTVFCLFSDLQPNLVVWDLPVVLFFNLLSNLKSVSGKNVHPNLDKKLF